MGVQSATGQAIVAYVTLKGGEEGSVECSRSFATMLRTKIGAIAKPANIVFTPELPKTRSGKIMRGCSAMWPRTGRSGHDDARRPTVVNELATLAAVEAGKGEE